MSATGFAGLMSSNATRTVKLASGIVLNFSKFKLRTHADRENAILERRGLIEKKVEELQTVLQKIKDKDIKERLLQALERAVTELIQRPAFAYADEDLEFQASTTGQAYELFLATKEKTPEMQDLEDAIVLLQSVMPDEDRKQIREGLDWSSELEYLKNSDTPSTEKENQNKLEPSVDGGPSSNSSPNAA